MAISARKTIGINDNLYNKKIYEIINECFRKNYAGWMKAWYNVNDSYAAWFPKLVKESNKPIESNGGKNKFANVISDDGMTIYENNYSPNAVASMPEQFKKKRFVFGRTNEGFRFLGVFSYVRSEMKDHAVHIYEREATDIDLTTFEYLDINAK